MSEPSGKLSKLSKLHGKLQPVGGGSKLLSLKPAKNKKLQSLKPVNGGKSGKLQPLGGAGGSKAMGKMLSEDYDSPSVIANASTDDESEDGAANAKLSKLRPIGAAIGKKILSENYERPSITAAEPSEDEDSRSVSLKGQRGVANAKLSKLSKLSPLPSTTRMRLLSQNYGDPSVERSLSDTGSEGSDSDPVSPSKFDLG